MPFHLGAPELILLLAIVLLLFGVGRISKIAGEMGKGIRAFREGLDTGATHESDSEEKQEG